MVVPAGSLLLWAVSWYQVENMSQTASFLTDYLFPGLLIGCGCLGLGVVNSLAQGAGETARSAPRGTSAAGAGHRQAAAPVSARPTPARAVMRARRTASGRVAPLQRVVRPTRHHVRFTGRGTRVSDAERERLRIFLAAAQPGAENLVTVVGHPSGRRGKRRARRRAARVVKLLQELGVVAIGAPQVALDESGAGRAVTIVVGKR